MKITTALAYARRPPAKLRVELAPLEQQAQRLREEREAIDEARARQQSEERAFGAQKRQVLESFRRELTHRSEQAARQAADAIREVKQSVRQCEVCFNLAVEAVKRLAGSRHTLPEATPAAFAVVLGTMVVNYCVSRYEVRRGRELGSEFLQADAAHTRTDVFITIGVLVGMLFAALPLATPGAGAEDSSGEASILAASGGPVRQP